MNISWLKWNPQKYNPMSDKWSRCAAGRLLVFAGGIIASAAITQHVTRKEAEAEYEEQLASVKGYYKHLLNNTDYSREAEEWTQEDLDANKSAIIINQVPIDVVNIEEDRPKLNALLRQYGESQFTGEEAVKVRGRHEPPEVVPTIHILTDDGYHEDDLDGRQEKVSALYYPRDDALVDPFNELVEDYTRVVGAEFVKKFDEDDDLEIVFVRNTDLGMDYEIEIVRGGSYAEDVLGYDPAPRRRPLRQGKDE